MLRETVPESSASQEEGNPASSISESHEKSELTAQTSASSENGMPIPKAEVISLPYGSVGESEFFHTGIDNPAKRSMVCR